VRLAESLGFAAVWLRDVPFDVQTFGDAGLTFDPFVYLGLLAGATDQIGLGVASVILPLRHPAHVAKAAASADVLSGGRLLLGVASGDRPDEFPAMGVPHAERGARFRAAFEYVERMAETAPGFDNPYGSPTSGMNMLPKPVGGRIPLLVTGGSQQPPEWLASHGDAWMTYPRPTLGMQSAVVADFRARVAAVGRGPRPVMQPLYVDLADDPTAAPTPIHLGLRLGVDRLVEHLTGLRSIGINHVAINLRFNTSPTEQAMRRLAERVLPALDP
ncbi:MAG: TIGR03571 family LLM class oxidoreductase, partial [Actinomycetota bacterium]